MGLALNTFSVIKARYEVQTFLSGWGGCGAAKWVYERDRQSSYYSYGSFGEAFFGLLRAGPKEIFRGAVASSLRDALYAGIFDMFYEHIKSTLRTCISLLCSCFSLTVTSHFPSPLTCPSSLDCSPRESRGASRRRAVRALALHGYCSQLGVRSDGGRTRHPRYATV